VTPFSGNPTTVGASSTVAASDTNSSVVDGELSNVVDVTVDGVVATTEDIG
jgi:hypothetical protein